MKVHAEYIIFEKEPTLQAFNEPCFNEVFTDLVEKARKHTSQFYLQLQTFFTKLSLAIIAGLKQPQYTAKRADGTYEGNFRKLLEFICKDVLKNQSLMYGLRKENVNEYANRTKHSLKSFKGDIESTIFYYNRIIDDLSEKLDLPEIEPFKIETDDSWDLDAWPEFGDNATFHSSVDEFVDIPEMVSEALGMDASEAEIEGEDGVVAKACVACSLLSKEGDVDDGGGSIRKECYYGIKDLVVLFWPKKGFLSEVANATLSIEITNARGFNAFKMHGEDGVFSAPIEGALLLDLRGLDSQTILKGQNEALFELHLVVERDGEAILENTTKFAVSSDSPCHIVEE